MPQIWGRLSPQRARDADLICPPAEAEPGALAAARLDGDEKGVGSADTLGDGEPLGEGVLFAEIIVGLGSSPAVVTPDWREYEAPGMGG